VRARDLPDFAILTKPRPPDAHNRFKGFEAAAFVALYQKGAACPATISHM
jgi:hypothetical protein